MKIYHIKELFKFKYSFFDIVDYFRANIRYWLYYNAQPLIRKHILEQINYRIEVMDKECYSNGSCKICGCNTIHLQMANKACEGLCYPVMFDKKGWKLYKECKDLWPYVERKYN